MNNMNRVLSYYSDGRLEGILMTVEALLLNKGLEVNPKNVSKVLRKLELSEYIKDILEVYF